MEKETEAARQRMRVLALLSHGPARNEPGARKAAVLLKGRRGTIASSAALMESLDAEGLTEQRGEEVALSKAGYLALGHARRDAAAQAQPVRAIGFEEMETADGFQTVAINLAESPLAQIARRKGRNGSAFLDEREVRSGERLRADFTRAQLMPRLGPSWGLAMGSGRRSGSRGSGVDLTDAALAARQRVDRAVEATGPELSGVLLDICCFLKGIEQVEAERGWPVRSGKVMLKAALGALARHYEPRPANEARQARIMHWGAEDYRPELR